MRQEVLAKIEAVIDAAAKLNITIPLPANDIVGDSGYENGKYFVYINQVRHQSSDLAEIKLMIDRILA